MLHAVVRLILAFLEAEIGGEPVAACRAIRVVPSLVSVFDADEIICRLGDGQLDGLVAAVVGALRVVIVAEEGARRIEVVLELPLGVASEFRACELHRVEDHPALAHALEQGHCIALRVGAVCIHQLEALLLPARPPAEVLVAGPASYLAGIGPPCNPMHGIGAHHSLIALAAFERHSEEARERTRAIELDLTELGLRLMAVVRRDGQLNVFVVRGGERELLARIALSGGKLAGRTERLAVVAHGDRELLHAGAVRGGVVVDDDAVDPSPPGERPDELVRELGSTAAAPATTASAGDLVAIGCVGRVPGPIVVLAAGRFENRAHLEAVLGKRAAVRSEHEAFAASLDESLESFVVLLAIQAELACV